jgi:PAS domain S-box-containing protein
MPLVDVRTEGLRLVHETLLGEALMASAVPIVVTDEAMRYLTVNDAACAFLGYTREQLLNLGVTDVVLRPADMLVDSTRRVLREGASRGTTSVRRSDGSETEVTYVSFSTTIAGMTHVVSILVPLG